VIQGFRIGGSLDEETALLAERTGMATNRAIITAGRRGAHRVDDRRVISGIICMLRTGARWRDCPPEYGPYTTIYNRFNRWSRQGIWLAMFKALTGSAALFGCLD
jgi:transposase